MTAPGWEDLDEQQETEDGKPYYYPNEGRFVHEWLLVTFRKMWTPEVRWCREWWEHPEARAVLKAVWHSWEHARHEPWRMAPWDRDVAYPLLDRLLSQQGPFAGCEYGVGGEPPFHDAEGRTVKQLPVDPLPDGLFDDVPCQINGDTDD